LARPRASSAERSFQSAKKQIRKGVAWNAVGLAVSKGASILAKLVLARLLLPEHFGFVSMVVVFTSISGIVGDLGFRLGLIQRQRDHRTRLLYDSAFWLLFGAAFLMIGVMWLVGVPFLVWFYEEPRLAGVALAMSTIVIFKNLQVVPEARLARLMRFKQIALAEISGMLIGCTAAILLALAGANVWSLVAQTLVAGAFTCAMMFAHSGWRPRLRVSLPALRDLSGYSRYLVGSRVLISLQQNMDYLLIGKLIGAHALGIYAIAFLLTETMRAQVYWLVSKAVFPFYSRAIGREEDIRAVYLGTVRYMSVTVFPAATLLILFASDFVPALFTSTWNAAIVPIQILATASIIVASAGTPGEVLRGIGRANLDFRINFGVALFVALPALWFGTSRFGLAGAAAAVLCHYCVSRVAFGIALRRLIGIRARDLLGAVQRALLGCVLMAAIALLAGPWHWVIVATLAALAYTAVVLPSALPLIKGFGTRPGSAMHPATREPALPL